MRIAKYAPNFFTCLNLLCGSIAITLAFHGLLHYAAILVGIAAVFDFLDGMLARLLNAYSSLGKELDSLADMVTFGFTPAVIILHYLQQTLPDFGLMVSGVNILSFWAFLITIFSALRLAKFNIDDQQRDSFIGLPTPANALLIVSFPFLLYYGDTNNSMYQLLEHITTSFLALILITAALSYLLVANLPLFSLKFKNYHFSDNKIRYFFLLGTLILFVVFGLFALPMVVFFYIILSVIHTLISFRNKNA